MSVLDALDATRICARWSPATGDDAVWARPLPVPTRRPVVAQPAYSWLSLTKNPQALLMTGMIGTVMVKDAVLRANASITHRRSRTMG